MQKYSVFVTMLIIGAMPVFAATPTITDVTAKQRYPWNGLVDISCKVTGINGTTNGLKFAVAAVNQVSGDIRQSDYFWVVQNGTNSMDRKVHTNGVYRLLWDAKAELGTGLHSNIIVRVTFETHSKVQLWKDGPYWADTNIGAEEPYEYGSYFWWGDTIGYKRVNDKWVASDGSSSDFSFGSSTSSLTRGKGAATLRSEGWITAGNVLAPEHDAAHVQWGGKWRMPTKQELSRLNSKCDWTWTKMNGVRGYVVRGQGDYALKSIFLPCTGYANSTSLNDAGLDGCYWSSVPEDSDSNAYNYSWKLIFHSTSWGYLSGPYIDNSVRSNGASIRPVQGFAE